MFDFLFRFISLILIISIIISVIIMIVCFFGLIFYSFGWISGYILHMFIGPDIIFGMTFEQFFGILTLVMGSIGTGRTIYTKSYIDNKIAEGIKKIVTRK